METIFSFLVNASAGIVLFYLVYWLLLRNETFYTANRWFLLATLAIALLLPLFPVKYTVITEVDNSGRVVQSISDTFKNIPVFNEGENAAKTMSWQQVLLIIYLTGATIFLLRLLTQTGILLKLLLKYRIKSLDGIRIVENEKYGLPFSFFNVVFINPKFHTQDDLPEILAHEKVHIRENHWFDLLFIELLTVIFWFNPFIWFFERAIKQNHEYLADKGVLAQGHTVGRYQALLVNQLMGMQIIGVTNNLNFALNTNRLKMMTKKKTSAKRFIRFSWILPVLAILLYAFAEPAYRVKEIEPIGKETSSEEITDQKTVKLSGLVLDDEGDPLPGTSVVVKGMTIGTVSDMDGRFTLDVPEDKSIVLSFVGKRTTEDSYNEITSGELMEGAYNRKYQMEESVVGIGLAEKLIPVKKKEKLVPPPQPPPPPPPAKGKTEKSKLSKGEKEEEVFFIVEDMPKYPGGSDALNNYAYKMQQKIASSKNIKGKAKVLFTVNAKGKVTDIKVVEKDNDAAAKGAFIIANEMPDWTPGKQRGKTVPVKYIMPVEFK